MTKRTVNTLIATALALGLVVAAPTGASAVSTRATAKTYTVTATLKNAQNLTVMLVGKSGRLLATQSIPTSGKVSLRTPKISSIAGATLQLVNGKASSSKGDYYGPVLVGWKGSKLSSATRVYTRLKTSTKTTLALGTITVISVTKQQGYAAVAKASTLADSATKTQVRAVKGKPSGVGNYGKASSAKLSAYGVRAQAPGDACSPKGTQTCSADGKELSPPTNQPANSQPANNQPANGAPNGNNDKGATVEDDELLGGDADDDGLPNAFDVNDDGDTKTDSADSETPAPKVTGDESGACTAVDFKIFTNFKATQPGFAGTINAYGTGAFLADATTIPKAIGSTMSMVFSPIATVCGSAVTKSELKGIGVPYAPAEYVSLGDKCSTGDYQWTIGNGKMCGSSTFSDGYTFSLTDLPSGQDTFSMRVTTADGKEYEFTASAGFVFVTHPMLLGYQAGETKASIDYSAGTPGPDGTAVNAPSISLKQTDKLKLSFYRPQRLAIDGEPGFGEEKPAFYDLGGFTYLPQLPNVANIGQCDSLSAIDTVMTVDTRSDTAVKPTMELEWDFYTKCFVPKSATWVTGDWQGGVDITVTPPGPGGNAGQKLFVKGT
ncbi:MAG: hypothetical protein NTU52_04365 [Actinobacteria bacterium]|nr:hypothetical protein [Actinomycetota bacterium]